MDKQQNSMQYNDKQWQSKKKLYNGKAKKNPRNKNT